MISRRRIIQATLTASATLALAACSEDPKAPAGGLPASDNGGANPSAGGASDGGGSPFDSITVEGEFGAEPQVSMKAPVTFTGLHSDVVFEGDGAQVQEGSYVVTRSAYFDPASGKLLGSQWQQGSFVTFGVSEDTIGPEAAAFFSALTAGSRYVMAGSVESRQVIQVGDLVGVALKRAEGESKDLPKEAPAFTLESDGSPTLSGAPQGDAPTSQLTAVAIEGSGPAAKKGDTLVMHYRGWNWETGEEFDSSWGRGEPFTFTLGAGQVITGWDEGLEGKTQGSQVLMVLPPDAAYGKTGESTHQLAGQTLIFVADILFVASPS